MAFRAIGQTASELFSLLFATVTVGLPIAEQAIIEPGANDVAAIVPVILASLGGGAHVALQWMWADEKGENLRWSRVVFVLLASTLFGSLTGTLIFSMLGQFFPGLEGATLPEIAAPALGGFAWPFLLERFGRVGLRLSAPKK